MGGEGAVRNGKKGSAVSEEQSETETINSELLLTIPSKTDLMAEQILQHRAR